MAKGNKCDGRGVKGKRVGNSSSAKPLKGSGYKHVSKH